MQRTILGLVLFGGLLAVTDREAASQPGGRPAPPQPGHVLPPFVRDRLNLRQEQQQQIAELEKEVRTRLGRILTPQQKQQFEDLLRQGPPDRPQGPGQRRGFGAEREGPPANPRYPARFGSTPACPGKDDSDRRR